MDTRHLKIFAAVYRTRSFTKAAEELYTSQPTISEHMRNLEDRLGCKLFDRLGRSIMPTPEAELLYPKAVEILNEMTRIQEMLASASSSVSGTLLIGASTIPGAYILPEQAAAFKRKYPNVSFQIDINDSAQIIKKISSHELYMGIVGAQIPSSNVTYTSFAEDELVLTVPPHSKLPDEITPPDLYDLDFLMREEGSGTGRNIEVFLLRQNIHTSQLKTRAVLGSSTAIKEAVKSDLGVAIISDLAIRDELTYGVLRKIKIKELEMKRSFFIVTPQKRSMPNHYQVFADFLQTKQLKPEKTGHQPCATR